MTTKNQNDGQPTPQEIKAAEKEGVLDAVRDSQTTQSLDVPPLSEDGPRFVNVIGTNQIEHLTDLGIEALKAAVDPKKDDALDEQVIANVLILERNGKNRTAFVKLLMDRLKIKDIRKELPQAGGPDYTNDVSELSKL